MRRLEDTISMQRAMLQKKFWFAPDHDDPRPTRPSMGYEILTRVPRLAGVFESKPEKGTEKVGKPISGAAPRLEYKRKQIKDKK